MAASPTHQVTNVGDKSFTVSWISRNAEHGLLKYGTSPDNLGNTAYDDRGQTVQDSTHHISIIGLTADTTYYYEIVSGGIIYNDNGSPYRITTGASLDFTLPEMIDGKVYQADGATPAEGAILYARIGSSQTLSCLVNSQGVWAMNIAPVREADYQSYYTHSGNDALSLDVVYGNAGSASSKVKIDTARNGTPAIVMTGSTTGSMDITTADNTMSTSTITAGIPAGGTGTGLLPWWGWLAIGFAVLAVVGLVLKKLVFYHD